VPKDVNVKAEVRRLEQRVSGQEAVSRLIFRVQMLQLARAEQLRKLAIAAVDSNPRRAAGALMRLRWFVEDLEPFHKHPPVPKLRKAPPAKARKR